MFFRVIHGHSIQGMLLVSWSERWRLQWEQHNLKAPQELSDEEIEDVPTESVHLERKETVY